MDVCAAAVTQARGGRLSLAAWLVLVGVSTSDPAPAQSNPPKDAADQIERGSALYAHLCSQCHGIDMVTPGTVVPDLREFPHNARDRFVETVMMGRNNRMPPWGDKVTPEQVDELWAYVRSRGE